MKKGIIILLVLALFQIGCYYRVHKNWHPKNLKGEIGTPQQMENGNYRVTPGYVKAYYNLYLEKAEDIEELSPGGKIEYAQMLTRELLIAEHFFDEKFGKNTFQVKPKMIQEIKDAKKEK